MHVCTMEMNDYKGAVHTKIDLSWIDLSSHLSVHIQIALDL